MLLIYNEITNPYFNLAMEEYLLKNFNEDMFILWRNENAVIVGKNQNTISEINLEYIKEHSKRTYKVYEACEDASYEETITFILLMCFWHISICTNDGLHSR